MLYFIFLLLESFLKKGKLQKKKIFFYPLNNFKFSLYPPLFKLLEKPSSNWCGNNASGILRGFRGLQMAAVKCTCSASESTLRALFVCLSLLPHEKRIVLTVRLSNIRLFSTRVALIFSLRKLCFSLLDCSPRSFCFESFED